MGSLGLYLCCTKTGKQAHKLELENGQEMKTNGPVLCVEDLRLAGIGGCRSQPVHAKMAEKRRQQWRENEANGGEWGGRRKEQAGGKKGLGGGGREGALNCTGGFGA